MKMFQQWFKPSPKHRDQKPGNTPIVTGVGTRSVARGGQNYVQSAQEGYQQNPIVYRCINLVARGIASVPWLLYQGDHELDQHEMLELLSMPSARQSGMAFMEEVTSHLLIGGNAFVYRDTTADGLSQLRCLQPERVKILITQEGEVSGFEWQEHRKKVTVPVCLQTGKSEVLHLKLFHPLQKYYGMSPLQAAALSIDQHNTVSRHNLSLLENGGRPSGAFLVRPNSYGPPLSDKQRESLKEDLKNAYEGAGNAGRVLFLEGDFEWKEMGQSLKDLDFIEGKNLSAREIAQCFGVPPMLVGVPGDATFANYKEARYHLWEDTLLPLLDYITGELNHWLAWEYGDDLRLAYDADQISALSVRREASWAKIATVDFLTINEKRQAVGYGPLPEGDVKMEDKCNM